MTFTGMIAEPRGGIESFKSFFRLVIAEFVVGQWNVSNLRAQDDVLQGEAISFKYSVRDETA